MDPFENRFVRSLLERLNTEISSRMEFLVTGKNTEGKGATEIAIDYKVKVAELKTLKWVGEVMVPEVLRKHRMDDENSSRRARSHSE